MSDVRMINRRMSLGDKSIDAYEGRSLEMNNSTQVKNDRDKTSNVDTMREQQLFQVKLDRMADIRTMLLGPDDEGLAIENETQSLIRAVLKMGYGLQIDNKWVSIEEAVRLISKEIDQEITVIELVQLLDVMLLSAIKGGQAGQKYMSLLLRFGISSMGEADTLPGWAKVTTRYMGKDIIDYCTSFRGYTKLDTTIQVAAIQFDHEFKQYRHNRNVLAQKAIRTFASVVSIYWDHMDAPALETTKRSYTTEGLLESVKFSNGCDVFIFTIHAFATEPNIGLVAEYWDIRCAALSLTGWEQTGSTTSGTLFHNKHLPAWTMHLDEGQKNLASVHDEADPDNGNPATSCCAM